MYVLIVHTQAPFSFARTQQTAVDASMWVGGLLGGWLLNFVLFVSTPSALTRSSTGETSCLSRNCLPTRKYVYSTKPLSKSTGAQCTAATLVCLFVVYWCWCGGGAGGRCAPDVAASCRRPGEAADRAVQAAGAAEPHQPPRGCAPQPAEGSGPRSGKRCLYCRESESEGERGRERREATLVFLSSMVSFWEWFPLRELQNN